MEISQVGKALMLLGGLLLAAGLILTAFGKVSFLGRLPGDIVWKRDNFTFYFPLATSLLLSALATLVLYVISRFTGRQ